jgi:hypothetical protein
MHITQWVSYREALLREKIVDAFEILTIFVQKISTVNRVRYKQTKPTLTLSL